MNNKFQINKIIQIAGKSTIYGYLNSILVFFQLGLIYRVLDNETLNGLWLTIFSIVSWIYLLDFGISNSLRNLIVKYKIIQDYEKVKSIISTGIFLSSGIFLFIFFILIIPIYNLNWNTIFNIDKSLITNNEIIIVIVTLVIFTMIKVNFNVMNAVYNVTDRNHWINLIILLGTLTSIILIIFFNILDLTSLFTIVMIVSGSPLISTILFFFVFKNQEQIISPEIKAIKVSRAKEIFKPGVYFLILQLCSLLFYSSDTFLISHFLTPNKVNDYQYTIKILSMTTLFFTALLNPLWTEIAKVKNDNSKIKDKIKKMIFLFSVFSLIIFLLNFFIKDIIEILTGKSSEINFSLVNVVSVFVILQMWCSLFQSILNALNILRLQVFVFGGAALLNVPLSLYIYKNLIENEIGIILGTIFSLLIPAIMIPLFLYRYKLKTQIDFFE